MFIIQVEMPIIVIMIKFYSIKIVVKSAVISL